MSVQRNLSAISQSSRDAVSDAKRLDTLCPELLFHILSYVDVSHRVRLKRVCQRWKNAVDKIPIEHLTVADDSRPATVRHARILASKVRRIFLSASEKSPITEFDASESISSIFSNIVSLTIEDRCHVQYPIDDVFVAVLAVNCKHLRDFHLKRFHSANPITDRSLKLLVANCPVKNLTIYGGGVGVTGSFLLHLKTDLQSLGLENCSFECLRNLEASERTKNVTALSIRRLAMPSAMMIHMGVIHTSVDLSRLVSSSLECLITTEFGFDHGSFQRACRLKELQLNRSVNDALLDAVSKSCPLLEVLVGRHARITKEGCVSLTRLERLKYLELSSSYITGNGGFSEICGMKSLTRLNAYELRCDSLSEVFRCDRLEVLYVSSDFEERALDASSACVRDRVLRVYCCFTFGIIGMPQHVFNGCRHDGWVHILNQNKKDSCELCRSMFADDPMHFLPGVRRELRGVWDL